ncbi:exoribonuclease II [Candidatus Pantoea carbekii]|uniref:Exoribonuclease 2 n=1 Tax=Candidatus Pantoea carbekii TaxID=1235990 RepID=U3U811_9GAMM|nr:exoribonuclease II [Candidatus Pantoea carbekii]AKC32076.1 exoribonuclease II Rnb [Candidatus Pantoea carbekii]BAO00602.1 Rnb protein [Candidatus Pantoea carbekii]
MFQDNILLAQLKKTLHAQIPRVEGIVKKTEKSFGFLEIDTQKSYFIPPIHMKKVMHGDRIIALIRIDKNRESAEPESLVEPFLTRFVGRVQKKESYLSIIPDHPLLKDAIQCRPINNLHHEFQTGDWAVAQLRDHPLKGDLGFYAELTEFITTANDDLAPWWVTLSRYNLEREAPEEINFSNMLSEEHSQRHDLTALDFITIDNASTEDMDDALYVTENLKGDFCLTIAIADPTAYISEGSELDKQAAQRAFTNYLPGFNIPMLPRKLSDHLCSLRPNVSRPALVCRVSVLKDGSVKDDIDFFTAWIKSKAKLVYDQVSDWIEEVKDDCWKPENEVIIQQINLLRRLCLARWKWRKTHALVFQERPDYRFIFGQKSEVLDIVAEPRRIANRIVEEAMILANICAAKILRDKLGFGIYNVHTGFDLINAEQISNILSSHGIVVDPKKITTLDGFCQLRRQLDAQPTQYLNSCIRRFQSFTEISTRPGPHFGLGLDVYATWTSPIRKFGDMINHRLLKAILRGKTIMCPDDKLTKIMKERRRLNRMAERDVNDWLYASFLVHFAGVNKQYFSAEIIDILRAGMRIRLQKNGAIAFIPSSFIHSFRDELICSQENGTCQIKGKIMYRVTDVINVTIVKVNMETRSVIANLVT